MESTVFPGCNNDFFFSFLFGFSPPKWSVLLLAVHSFDFFFSFSFWSSGFFCAHNFSTPSHPRKMFPRLCSPRRHCYWDDLFLCLCFYVLVYLYFFHVFYLFVFGLEKKTKLTNKDKYKPAVVHAKTKLVPLFSFSVMDLNISIYWYIKSDWKPSSGVLYLLFLPFVQTKNIQVLLSNY